MKPLMNTGRLDTARDFIDVRDGVEAMADVSDLPIPQNTHPGQEFNYMLEGTMLVKVQDNEVTLEVGDSVIFDATKPHGMKAVGGPVKFLAIINV